MKDLKLGDEGPEVGLLRAIVSHRLGLELSGDAFDNRLKMDVMRFQRQYVTGDYKPGEVGYRTWHYLLHPGRQNNVVV